MNEEKSIQENQPSGGKNSPGGSHRLAVKMKLRNGCEKEYKKRHDSIWPDLKVLLHSKGISDYAIYLEEETGSLFGVLRVENPAIFEELSSDPLMKQWWAYMKDVMETHPDNSPVSIPLTEVFYLP